MDDKVAREYIAEMDKTTSLEEALPLMVKMNDYLAEDRKILDIEGNMNMFKMYRIGNKNINKGGSK